MRFLSLLVGAASLLSSVVAQTFTDCDPTKRDGCPNDPAFGLKDHSFVFNSSRTLTDSFNITNGALKYGANGAEFTINKAKDSPTVKSKFYIFFGTISVVMRAASGQGIISSIVLQSEDLDEVDWEFMGGFPKVAQSNYFGKGNTTSFDRAVYHNATSDVHNEFHNYTVDWTKEKIDFYIDSVKVRTLMYADANGGKNYPQTPCTLRMGIWAGGDKAANNKGTIEWAGGLTDYSKGPFTMFVKSAQVSDYSTGKEYSWTDRTGNWQSIKSLQGNSTVATTIAKTEKEANAPPALTISQKFQALPQTSKIAIYAGGGGAAALLIFAAAFACIRQRRAGRRERDIYNAKVEKEREEAYKDQMELREKGLGGWDQNSKQGDDALGGWGGSHITKEEAVPPMPAIPNNVFAASAMTPSRTNSPAPTVPRVASPGVVSPLPQSPRQWTGGNQGGMIQNAQNSYSGGYGRGPAHNYSRSPSYASQAPSYSSRSPSFPSQGPQGNYNGGYSQSQGSYQRF